MAALQSHQEHLLAPQKFSLRPSAADENIFARVREARALHHDQPRGALLSPLGETLTSAQNPYTPEPLVPLCGSGEGLPPLPASLSSGALTAMRLEASRSPPPNPLEVPAPPRDRSVSPRPPSPPPAQPKSAPSSPRPPASTSPRPPSEPRPINNTTRKRRPPRAGTRSASPNAQDGITPPPSRPNSYGSTAAILSAVMRNGSAKPAGGKSDEQPKQVTVSPRRPEQSALVDQMVVSASGGALAGGSVRALLEWAVKTRDLAAQADLLFTFRLCAPAEELFAAFCDMAADTLYRTRLLEFLRLWLSGYFVMDFRRKTLFSRMLRTAETMLAADEVTNLKLLCLNANFRFSNTGVAALRKQAVERMLVAKGGLLHSQQLAIDSVPEKVLAEQLTSISSHLFRNICASELVEWILRGNRAEEAAPHITEILAYSARLSAWVTTEAVKGTPLSRLVGLGQRLQVLGNFEALRAVLNGLQHRAVVRLAAAWQALPADGLAAFDALEDLLSASGNFQLYRQTLTLRANQPTVPVLSICLHDLTVAYQRGAQASLLPNGMLSAAFVARLGNPLRALFKLQRNEPYTIVQQPALINWLLNVKPMDDSELAALAPQPLQSSGGGGRRESIAGGAAAAEAREEAAGGNAKGLKRALSARSLNRFLADLIYRTDEPEAASGGGLGAGGGGGGAGSTGTTTTTPNNASPLPPKDKDRVTQP